MKNTVVFIFIFFLFLSCGNNNESAINDLGDSNSYIEHREKKKENKSDFNTKASNISNNEINVSVENVISEGEFNGIFKYSLGFR